MGLSCKKNLIGITIQAVTAAGMGHVRFVQMCTNMVIAY